MRSLKVALLISLSFFLINSGFGQSIEEEFQRLLDSAYQKNQDAVGITAHIESPKLGISWNGSVGISDKETQNPLVKEQPALIASNTKTYVAVAILKLVESGQVDLNDPISGLLKDDTEALMLKAGYQPKNITVKHLLSHTSGIEDYVDSTYFNFVDEFPNHQWTRDEQIIRSMQRGAPIADPGTAFSYADINYLLLTEIIENKTEQSFYVAIRALINFKKLGLNTSWFIQLEKPPTNQPLAHQYWSKREWDSYDINPSWDLYGGGGMATSVKDLALFFQYLFEGKIIKDHKLLSELSRLVLPSEKSIYCLGIRKISFHGSTANYHGGFWGTDVMYLPEYDTTIAFFTLEKDKRDLNAELSYLMLQKVGAALGK